MEERAEEPAHISQGGREPASAETMCRLGEDPLDERVRRRVVEQRPRPNVRC
jgi:hypothetical protein